MPYWLDTSAGLVMAWQNAQTVLIKNFRVVLERFSKAELMDTSDITTARQKHNYAHGIMHI